MLEDVTIHESFICIIWLMISVSKGFLLKHEMVKWLLGVVYYLSCEKKKTFYNNKDIEEISIDKDIQEIDILQCLRIRKAYGGMKGDMNMIEYYVHLIYHGKETVLYDKIPRVQLNMDNLEKNEWLYEANDFHCNRYVLDQVKDYFPEMRKEEIKELIWIFSSSLNHRVVVVKCEKMRQKWGKIEKVVRRIQKNCKYY